MMCYNIGERKIDECANQFQERVYGDAAASCAAFRRRLLRVSVVAADKGDIRRGAGFSGGIALSCTVQTDRQQVYNRLKKTGRETSGACLLSYRTKRRGTT